MLTNVSSKNDKDLLQGIVASTKSHCTHLKNVAGTSRREISNSDTGPHSNEAINYNKFPFEKQKTDCFG